MDHRAVSLKFLSMTGLIPVKVRPGQKDPFPEWDPRNHAGMDHKMTLMEISSNPDLNLGALFYDRYIDIDVDADSPYIGPALDYFLPQTPYVWGRKSKPKSHRVYALNDPFDRAPYGPILRFMKKMEKGFIDEFSYSIEARGGKPENGLFSVLPGSKHPSGELVQWANDVDPTVGGAFVEFDKLLRSIRLAIVTAMIVPYWGPGVRNDMSLALAGTLWRIRTATRAAFKLDAEEEGPPGHFILDRSDAEAIFTAVMQIAGDKHGDERQRMLNLKNSWRKLDTEAGAKVTGGKVLAELIGPEVGPKVVKALYRLLSDNDAAEIIEQLSEDYVMWYGPGVIIDLSLIRKNRPIPWMTKEQTANSMGGQMITIGDSKVSKAQILFNSTIINRVGGLTFDPSTTESLVDTPDQGLMVNQWRGFAVKPCEQQVKREEVAMFVDYVKEVIADGDEDAAHWVFAWLADLLKRPHQKPGTALVLVGVEGAGKSFLGSQIMGQIIGPTHYAQTNNINTLTHNFNTIIDNKIFLQCDESQHSYQKDVASRLKSIITDPNIIIEPKGINSYVKPNHMHFLFTSNEEHAAIFISPSPYERRFTVLRVSSKHAKDESYWAGMYLWTPQALPKIMRWLMDYKYDRWLVMRPIETLAKKKIQSVGVDIEVQWMLTRIAEGFPVSEKTHDYWFQAYNQNAMTPEDKKHNVRRRDVWPDQIVMAVLEEDLRAYIRAMGKPVWSGSLVTSIKRVIPESILKPGAQVSVRYLDRHERIVANRVRLYDFPDEDQILTHLRSRYGSIVDDVVKDMAEAARHGVPQTDVAHRDKEEF